MVQTLVGLLIVTMNKTNTYHPQEEFLKQIIVTTIIHIISFILTEQVWVALISDSANKNKPWCNWVDIWFLDVRCYFLSVLCFHFPNKASKMVGCLGGEMKTWSHISFFNINLKSKQYPINFMKTKYEVLILTYF